MVMATRPASGGKVSADRNTRLIRITERAFGLMVEVRDRAKERLQAGSAVGFKPTLGLGHTVEVSLEVVAALFSDRAHYLRRAKDLLVERLCEFLDAVDGGVLRTTADKAVVEAERRARKSGAGDGRK